MKFLKFLQIPPVPTTGNAELMGWIIGILTSFTIAILVYLRALNKERIDDLKNEVVSLKLLYSKELQYSKDQDRENVKLLSDTGTILENSVKKLENNSEILRDNSEVLRNIKSLQSAIDAQIKSINLHNNG